MRVRGGAPRSLAVAVTRILSFRRSQKNVLERPQLANSKIIDFFGIRGSMVGIFRIAMSDVGFAGFD